MDKKFCNTCKQLKETEEFSFKIKKEGKLQSQCKLCKRAKIKEHYKDNKEDYLIKQSKRRQMVKDFVLDYKLKNPCVDCGETNPIVLDFDHVNGVKIKAISQMRCGASLLEDVIKEIAKCEVRCANCHRIVTHERRQEDRDIKRDKMSQ